MLINSIMSWSVISIIILSMLSFFGASYSLYLYSFSQHGKLFSGLYSFYLITSGQYILMLLHFIPLVLLFMMGDYIF